MPADIYGPFAGLETIVPDVGTRGLGYYFPSFEALGMEGVPQPAAPGGGFYGSPWARGLGALGIAGGLGALGRYAAPGAAPALTPGRAERLIRGAGARAVRGVRRGASQARRGIAGQYEARGLGAAGQAIGDIAGTRMGEATAIADISRETDRQLLNVLQYLDQMQFQRQQAERGRWGDIGQLALTFGLGML